MPPEQLTVEPDGGNGIDRAKVEDEAFVGRKVGKDDGAPVPAGPEEAELVDAAGRGFRRERNGDLPVPNYGGGG